jgi:hypothetical protein
MNILLRKPPFLVLLLVLAIPLLGEAQQVVRDTIFESQTFEYDFISDPNDPSLVNAPEHGTISWQESPANSFNYHLVYTPNDGYIGDDSFRFLIWKNTSPVFTPEYLKFEVHIAPSLVTAVYDYATTTVGQSVTIDVLDNDYSSNGVLILRNIPLVNHGTASINGDAIDFTPAPGFEGLAYLNYVVCDDIGTCDNGTASVFVLGTDPPQSDTTILFTRKNKSQVVFVPPAYNLIGGPYSGTYDDTDEIPTYTPDTDFIGDDYLNFDFNGVLKVIKMTTLDLEDNYFAFDDQVFMTPYEGEIEINVLANDEYGIASDCWQLTSGAQYGTVEWIFGQDAKGVPRYTPAPGFTGVDWFTYTICPPGGNPGNVETATVYVFVSNYEPAASNFYMTTPKLTPLVIGYNVPIPDFSFEVTVQPDLGTVSFMQGNVDTMIYGQQVTGYNVIIYTPDSSVEFWNG